MRAYHAAKRLGDTGYEAYLNGIVLALEDVAYTREEAATHIGPSLVAVSRLHRTLESLGIRNTKQLAALGIGDLAAEPGVGLRQLEVACCLLDAVGADVDKWIANFRGRTRKAATVAAQKRGVKRKAGKRTYRKAS